MPRKKKDPEIKVEEQNVDEIKQLSTKDYKEKARELLQYVVDNELPMAVTTEFMHVIKNEKSDYFSVVLSAEITCEVNDMGVVQITKDLFIPIKLTSEVILT